MRKTYIFTPILVFIFFILISFTIFNSSILTKNPFTAEFNLFFPYFAQIDSKDNIYIVDNRLRRLIKTDTNGKILWIINGGKREKDSFYEIWGLEVDSHDRIYVYNFVKNLDDGTVEKEEIKRYTPDGKFDKNIVEYLYKKENNTNKDLFYDGKIVALTLKKDFLYYLTKEDDKNILIRKDIDKTNEEKIFTTQTLEAINIAMISQQEMAFTKKDGKIYKVNKNGDISTIEILTNSNENIYPYGLDCDSKNNLFYCDLIDNGIYRLNGNDRQIIISSLRLKDKLKNNVLFKNFKITNDKAIFVNETNNNIIITDLSGNIKTLLNKLHFGLNLIVFNYLVWICLILSIIIFIFLIIIVYFKILNKRLSIILKQLLVFIPLLILSIFFIFNKIYSDFYAKYEKEIFYKIAMLSQLGSKIIDGDKVELVNSPSSYLSDNYNFLQSKMSEIINENKDEWNSQLYCIIYRYHEGMFYITVDLMGFYGVMFPYIYADKIHKKSFFEEKTEFGIQKDYEGDWMVSTSPIKNSNGEVVGVFEVGLNYYIKKELNSIFFKNILQGTMFTLGGYLSIFLIFAFILLFSLKNLRDAVEKFSNGNMSVIIKVRSNDEIGDLGKGFNIMSNQIKDYINKITDINKAQSRFVPQEFLTFLEKDSITSMNLGDQIQKKMTILFSDIRSFTTLSEMMTPKENFDFLNSYLRRVGPIIRKNNGFIDKYIGDGIMALFPQSCENALISSIEMQKEVSLYNTHRKKANFNPISIGIGLHYGNLMLGIIGEEERIEGTVISDAVNLTARLEGLTKKYDCQIIVSEDILKNIADNSKYNFRFVDMVKVKGKKNSINIFEIFDGNPQNLFELKLETKHNFETALVMYHSKHFTESKELFLKVLNTNPLDVLSKIYINRINFLLKNGVPENWNGVEQLDEK
ncbi:MAG: hypothetical protein A2086_07905 [Spirochaetes bacterium GWD1_27_9]|nr:MAG: hypothetical protein A2Y34_04970 [Spirochaetes bacterium GWC1_27_15]OHD46101.1 MAG: hypothetical protein A2086_07905 [Spirochaetes bacterium GWD1_27_9]